MKTHIRPPRAVVLGRHGRGMTLIEVLVTLVIISVGLLGVAALQLTTVRNNYDAFVRSQAAVLASDMLDRIRANRAAAIANQYTLAFGDDPGTGSPPAWDMTQWKATLVAQLPNGDGAIRTVQVVGGPDDPVKYIVTISIRWGERTAIAADQQVTFVTSSQI